MKILVVEDDQRTASFIIKGLRQSGYAVDHAANGEDGFHMASTESYDVAVMDIMLPFKDGITVTHQLRDLGIQTPVLFLSAKNSVDDRVRGLQSGGDDYLVKPFAFSELLARIQALIRRSHAVGQPETVSVGGLEVDFPRRKVFREGKEIELQPREFALLEYLIRNRGRVVSKTMIIEHVWDYNFDPGTNVVEARICRLREKIDRPFSSKLIHTIKGAGYVLEERS